MPPEQLRRSWRSGLLTTGYVLNLPWKVWPSTEKLRVTAVLQLTDGRVFEADKDITVRLTPVNRRPALVPDDKTGPSFPPAPHSTDDGGPPLLPSPRPINPTKPPKAAPTGEVPAPLTGDLHETSARTNAWKQVDPPPSPPATEILRPVPLKQAN